MRVEVVGTEPLEVRCYVDGIRTSREAFDAINLNPALAKDDFEERHCSGVRRFMSRVTVPA